MAPLNLTKARKLNTDAEMKVVEASQRNSIGKLSPAELKKKVDQARKLRDKWRDQATRQRRDVQQQQGSRATDKTARSQEKAEIFDEVLGRFTAQLEKAERANGATKKKAATPTKTPKAQRVEANRASRASTRDDLAAEQEGRNAGDVKKKTKNVKKAMQEPMTKQTKASPAVPPASPSSTKKTVKRKTAKHQPAEAALTKENLVNPNELSTSKADQRQARAKAKAAQVDRSGLTSRVLGHVSARGRRAQGRRDARQ